ncbi:NO-inducible flavohemoprotein [Longirhabdus pacifica]|uniref:NO-inducible flavohemoprotein n=1 Tax=Longirhabdus pacifica TaxID=2305227 RepID=UPI001008C854|nr:NO-inducible flavohemoprotein [Longirhabdus pacifica]
MLSQKHIKLIKATAPLFQLKGKQITSRFYQTMFNDHPELLHIFNQTNQQQGKQQTALANTLYAAAKHIDQLEAILPSVIQTAHKHRGLGVKPEHYPIVGTYLLQAMAAELGDEANGDVLVAWKQTYDIIADLFMQEEQKIYEAAANQLGGWDGFRTFVIKRKEKESDTITSFYLYPGDGKSIASFLPGQYITVKLMPEGSHHTQLRQYSLSNAPGSNYYRISVKREDARKNKPKGFISTYLHEKMSVGDPISLSSPAGSFTLERGNAPVMLLSGGVGLTPMLSMLHSMVEDGCKRDIYFIHAARNGNVHAMDDEVRAIAEAHQHIYYATAYETPTISDLQHATYDEEGIITKSWLQQMIPVHQQQNLHVYMCGPIPFMQRMYRDLQEMGIHKQHIRYEYFGPTGTLKEISKV